MRLFLGLFLLATLRILSIQPASSQSLFATLKVNRAVLSYLHFLAKPIFMSSSKFRLLAKISRVNPFGVSS